MLQASGLIPARFLTLLSHLVLTLTVLMAREDNVLACLPLDHTQLQFDRKDTELAAGLGVAIALMAIEMVRICSWVKLHVQFVSSSDWFSLRPQHVFSNPVVVVDWSSCKCNSSHGLSYPWYLGLWSFLVDIWNLQLFSSGGGTYNYGWRSRSEETCLRKKKRS